MGKKSRARREVAQAHEGLSRLGWERGRTLFTGLVRGRQPNPLAVWGLVLDPTETALFELPLTYSRLYGTDATYSTGGGVYFGPPAVVLAGLVGNALANSSARARADAASQVQWRDHQLSQVIVTDQRIICSVYGQPMSFWYSGTSGFYPSLETWTTTLEFHDNHGQYVSPLQLHGTETPTLNAYICWALHGLDGLLRHPGLARLRAATTPVPLHPAPGTPPVPVKSLPRPPEELPPSSQAWR